MKILATYKKLKYPIYLIHTLDTSELSEDRIFIVDVKDNSNEIGCFMIACNSCPLSDACTLNEPSHLKQHVINTYFPDMLQTHPEYFI